MRDGEECAIATRMFFSLPMGWTPYCSDKKMDPSTVLWNLDIFVYLANLFGMMF